MAMGRKRAAEKPSQPAVVPVDLDAIQGPPPPSTPQTDFDDWCRAQDADFAAQSRGW